MLKCKGTTIYALAKRAGKRRGGVHSFQCFNFNSSLIYITAEAELVNLVQIIYHGQGVFINDYLLEYCLAQYQLYQ